MLKLVTSVAPNVKVVFVDTGYLPADTTDYMETLRRELNLNLTIARPKLTPAEIEAQYGKLWEYDNHLYGTITKVEPMNRALDELGTTAILSGLRSEQTSNRGGLTKVSFDMGSHRFKVLPILDWTKVKVKEYMKEMELPKHPLELRGYTTVGDAHSSRAAKAGEDDRATRFGGKATECGLHSQTVPVTELLGYLNEPLQSYSGFVVFSKPNCRFCKAAKKILNDEGIPFIERDVSKAKFRMEMYTRMPSATFVPQILWENAHIGGFEELHAEFGIQTSVEFYVQQANEPAGARRLFRNGKVVTMNDASSDVSTPKRRIGTRLGMRTMSMMSMASMVSKESFSALDQVIEVEVPNESEEKSNTGKLEKLSFAFGEKATVPVFLGCDVRDEVLEQISELEADKVLLVTEEKVDSMHGDYFSAPFKRQTSEQDGGTGEAPEIPEDGSLVNTSSPEFIKIVLPEGEGSKSWDQLTRLMKWHFEIGATKRSVILALGGGALLNVAGLFASLAFRGSKLVYVPTTLLAMHDVVTSMKTSICMDGRQNNAGSFYAPTKILIDIAFCRTLTGSELVSGLGGLAKKACLFGDIPLGFAHAFSKESDNGRNGGPGEEISLNDDVILNLTRFGIQARMSVISNDAYEKTDGMVFEYGQTIGHALVKSYDEGLVPHGLGVAYGMLSSAMVAERLGFMSPQARAEHDQLCHLLTTRWPLPEPKPSVQVVMERAMRDPKRGIAHEAADELSDILLRKVGHVVASDTSGLSKFPRNLIEEWLIEMGFPDETKQGGSSAQKISQKATNGGYPYSVRPTACA
jgi:phosphoadenosine phosphosulfate reductase